jgi:hypothetical protein
MAQLHGKQIQNDSVSLNKLNDSGMVTFTNATMSFDSGSRLIQSNSNINSGTDVVNKNYVDVWRNHYQHNTLDFYRLL